MSYLQGKKVFIIDDEADIREILIDALHPFGGTFLAFPNGQEALEAFQREKPDVILSDGAMPKLDGMSLFREIRKVDNDVALVLLSAYADRLEQRALNAGADAIFLKPFKLEQLNEFLERLMRTGSARKRRLHARIFCRLKFLADLDPHSEAIQTHTFNLSLGGFFVELFDHPLPPHGTRITFEVPAQESWKAPVQGVGVSRWSRDQRDAMGPRGFGMEFVDASPELIEAIEDIIVKYVPEEGL